MEMNIDRVLYRISEHEGFVSWVYDDATGEPIVPGSKVVGHPTVGIGTCLDKSVGCGLTRRQAEFLRDDKVTAICREMDRRIGWWRGLGVAHPQAAEVLVEVAYHIGVGGLLGFKNMLAAAERRDLSAMRAELLDSQVARRFPTRYDELARLIAEAAAGQ